MYMDDTCFSYVMMNIYEKYNDMVIRSPLLFVRDTTCVRGIISGGVRRLGAPCFYAKSCCLIGRVCIRELAPCVDRGHADDQTKLHCMSICVETLIVLHGIWGHALKVNQSLSELIVKLKEDIPESQ
jgi:hypothetical protein